MLIPENLIYTRDHQWILRDQDPVLVTVGMTDFFQSRMEEIIYLERPPEGETILAEEPLFLIESGKTVYEFISPLSGVLREINVMVVENPGIINTDPYGKGWLIKVAVDDASWDTFLSPGRYRDYAGSFTYPLPPAT
jgi:glycine cleavage system H protein